MVSIVMECLFQKTRALLQFCTIIMAKHNERRLAKEHFLKSKLTQKEIAQIVGIQEKTLTEWIKKFGWKEERDALFNSAKNQIKNLKNLISKLTDQRLELINEIDKADEAGDFEKSIELQAKANRLSSEVANYNKALLSLDKESKISLAVYLEVMNDIFKGIQNYDSKIYMSLIDFQEEWLAQTSLKIG